MKKRPDKLLHFILHHSYFSSVHAGHTAELLVHNHRYWLGLIEAVHHVAGDAVFLVHHGDGLFHVVSRVALAAAVPSVK